jgi:hypothetical protein
VSTCQIWPAATVIVIDAMKNAHLNIENLVAIAAKRALVELGAREVATLRETVEGIVAQLGCGLDQEQMVRDIANYPLGSDPMVAASRSPKLVGMQIRHTESGYWIPNHRFLIHGLIWVLFQLKVAGSNTLARTNACTVYSLLAYAVRQQTSN